MVGRSGVVANGRPGGDAVVFVSYSRADADWRRRFVTMLAPLVRERRLEVWSDERNVVGEEWRPQLAEAIGRSTLALLLVSPDFLASRFIMEEELPALIERGVRLVCVLVRPALWDWVPTLERVQWAHDPRHDGPLSAADDPDGQIVRSCKALLPLLDRLDQALARPGDQVPGGAQPAAAAAAGEAVDRSRRLGELHDVPPLPAEFIPREGLERLRQRLLEPHERALGITGDVRALGLHGQGGIGKTVLACALARDEEVRHHFPDGVYWVTIGEQGDPAAAQLGAPAPVHRTLW